MADQFHTIVIGAGHNGLACAATLARAGKSVLVLEAAAEAGGAARNREFAPGFRASSAHFLHGLAQELVTGLDLARHGFRLAAHDLPTHALVAGAAPIRLGEREVRGEGLSAKDIAAYGPFMARMQRFAATLLPVFRMVPPRLVFDGWAQKLVFMKLAWRLRSMGREDMRELMRIIGMNVYDLLDEHFDSPALKGAIAFDAVLGAEWGPRAPSTVLVWLHRLTALAGNGGTGVSQPAGGSGAVSNALAASAQASGTQLRLGTAVKRILVENDRAVGVELADGEQLRAQHIVSNADPHRTFMGLLGAAHLDTGFVRRLSNVRSKGHAGKLHLALRELPKFTGLGAEALGDRIVLAGTMDDLERAFNPSKYKEVPSAPAMEISLPTVRDPSLAPSGRHVLSAIVQWLPYDDGPGREAKRAAALQSALATLERLAPGIGALVESAELLMPADIEQEYGITGGHWHHAALGFDQFFFIRPLPGAAQHSTPVAGLYLCGAGCHPGGGVMGVAGRNAATQVLEGARA
jgi:phytoene dehydrogenase-like protein